MTISRTDEEIIRAFKVDVLLAMRKLQNDKRYCKTELYPAMRRVSSLVTDGDLKILDDNVKHNLISYAEQHEDPFEYQLRLEIARSLFMASINKILEFCDEHNCTTTEELEFKCEIMGVQIKDWLRPDYYNDNEGNFEDFNLDVVKPPTVNCVYNYIRSGVDDGSVKYMKILVDLTQKYHVWNLVDTSIAEVIAAHIDRFSEEKYCARAIELDRLLFGPVGKCIGMRLSALRKELQDILDVLGLEHSIESEDPDFNTGYLTFRIKGSKHGDGDPRDIVVESEFPLTWNGAFDRINHIKDMIRALKDGDITIGVRHDGNKWQHLKHPLKVPKFSSICELALKLAATNEDYHDWSTI